MRGPTSTVQESIPADDEDSTLARLEGGPRVGGLADAGSLDVLGRSSGTVSIISRGCSVVAGTGCESSDPVLPPERELLEA